MLSSSMCPLCHGEISNFQEFKVCLLTHTHLACYLVQVKLEPLLHISALSKNSNFVLDFMDSMYHKLAPCFESRKLSLFHFFNHKMFLFMLLCDTFLFVTLCIFLLPAAFPYQLFAAFFVRCLEENSLFRVRVTISSVCIHTCCIFHFFPNSFIGMF